VVAGVDLATLGEVTEVPKRVVAGRLPSGDSPGASAEAPIEVAVGSSLADRIGAREGAEVRLIVPFAGAGGGAGAEAGAEPLSLNAKVVGIVKMGMYEYDSKYVFAPISALRAALKQPDRVTSFKIRLRPGADSAQASARLTDTFGFPFRSKDWAQLNRNLFYAIKLEKAVISILLTAIVIVAAFNVVSTLMMMIHDKGREIAILKAMGFRPSQSFGLFCFIGVGMGVLGTAVGVGLGLFLSQVLARTRLIQLPPDIYYIGFLPVVTHWRELALIAALAIFISFAATWYPAWKVSRRPPLEGLRHE
jgi:lipoprotein-releasing system permease protein